MKTLNLTDIDKSEIKYQIQKFPDGQNNIVIEGTRRISLESTLLSYERIFKENVEIKSRLNNFQDLELIICATKSLRALDVKEIHLYVPYFMGARSDRQFEQGGNRYLADIICPIINSLNFESVTVLDPHSYVLGNLLNNFKQESNSHLVKTALNLFGGDKGYKSDSFTLVAPDAGATHKIYKLAEQIGYTGDIVTCTKERDSSGKLTKTVVPLQTYIDKDIVIIDDICDGGATFINIAKEIWNIESFNNKIYLIVTHGIFSKGFQELFDHFDGIYCTNSYAEIKNCNKGTYALTNGGPTADKWVKQLNVF